MDDLKSGNARSWTTVKIAAKTVEAEGITSFELVHPEGAVLRPFSAGSHIDVEVAPGLIRQYSLCNPPDEQHRYRIAVLREPNSRGGSVALVDTVHVGATIRISEPRNLFALDHSAERMVLMAGGIGITPILCMAERLARTSIPFEMHYGARNQGRMAFYEQLRASRFADKVHFHFDDDRTTALDLDGVLAPHGPSDHLYVCGPKGFIDAVLSAAERNGWSESQVHREFFAAEEISRSGDEPFEIELASSGKRFAIPTDKSCVDVLLANGIDVPVSCEQGVCGTCVTRVLGGTPDHRDMFLTKAEHALNDQFTPCCSRAKSPLLVLDL